MYAPSYVLLRIITALEQVFPNESVDQWIKDAKVITLADDTLVLYSPYLSSHNQILTKCIPYMTDVVNHLLECNVQLVIWGDQDLQENLCLENHSTNDSNSIDTFEEYVIGDSNIHAVNLAHTVVNCQKPPLIIYGPSGVGKTHLLKAIKQSINKSHPSKVVRYLTADRFTAELIWSLNQGTYESFIQQYHSIDALLIDDIHFLSGREATQKELAKHIEYLYQNRKQVVMASSCPPSKIPNLNDCLRIHLDSFDIAGIALPEFTILYEIAARVSEKYRLPLDQSKLRYIAESCPSNVRRLTGILKKLRAIYELDTKELNIENIDSVIRSY